MKNREEIERQLDTFERTHAIAPSEFFAGYIDALKWVLDETVTVADEMSL
jgi:hypothetical protein